MVTKRRRIVAALVLGGLAVATGWGLWTIRPILAPFLLAIVVAYLVSPMVGSLCRVGLSRWASILAVYAVLGFVGAFAVGKVLPGVIGETQRLAEAIPQYSRRALELVDGLQQNVRAMDVPLEWQDALTRSIREFEVRSVGALGSLMSFHTLRRAVEMLASLILAPFVAFYVLRDSERFKERFVRSLPGRWRSEILQLLRDLDRVLSGYVRGQIILSLAVGTLAAVATGTLGMRYYLLLGIWAGLTEFIPYVGPIVGAIPAVVAGLSISPWVGVKTVIAFAAIQQIENAVLSPKIMGDSIGIHPLMVLFAVLAGGYVAGFWGLILALPVAGVVRVLWCFLVARLTEAPGLMVAAPALRPEREE